MTRREIRDISASIHHRLRNISHERREDFQFVLLRYANERLLYRLSKSAYADQFVLKGATLFIAWTKDLYRPTRDLDFLGFGDSTAKTLEKVFRNICLVQVDPDGLVFDPDSIKIAEIREELEYPGQRITLTVKLGRARAHLQIDIGFGDVVTPEAAWQSFPTLLDLPQPKIRTYSRESVIAEKLHTLVNLGIINSRLRDYYDLYTMSQQFAFDGKLLQQAIQETFKRRNTPLPKGVPSGLGPEFVADREKQRQWQAFIKTRNVHGIPDSLKTVVEQLQLFLMPLLQAAANGTEFNKHWKAGDSWR